MDKLPRLFRLCGVLVLLYLVVFSAMRLGFWLAFANPHDPIGGGDLAQAFYVGMKFDLRLALLLLLPPLLLAWLRPLDPFRSRAAHYLWIGYFSLSGLGVLLFYFLDFGHFAYLKIRTDVNVLRFLDNFATSAQMMWESYPIVWLTLALLLLLALNAYAVHRLLGRFARAEQHTIGRRRRIATITAAVFLVLFGLYGKISWYPLRWSDAFFSTHAFASAVALNPLLYFYDTVAQAKHQGPRHDKRAVRTHYGWMADYLGVTQKDEASLNFQRSLQPEGTRSQQPNVVIVILESFASYKSGLSGNPLDPTPNIDRLAADGAYFENFFVPSTGTARSVFAFTTGIPDVLEGTTASSDPTLVRQHSVLSDFEGYEKFYFLGGSASWRNIRGLLSNNIEGIRIFEEGSYDAPRVDVWGISDLDLFKEANQILGGQEKPFVAVIQTSGNHRPYTIPEDNDGFVIRQESPERLSQLGFESNEEYNSYRFMDHSVGRFMTIAQESPYFDNTLFAFFGDHGITGNAGEHTGKAETQLALGLNRVPFIIYGPRLLTPSRESKVASELDVLPTLAGLAGQRYTTTTLGRDLFDKRFDGERYAFIIRHARDPQIGVIDNQGFFFQTRLNSGKSSLHRVDSDTPRRGLNKRYPERAEELERITRAYYETARWMLSHNTLKDLTEAP